MIADLHFDVVLIIFVFVKLGAVLGDGDIFSGLWTVTDIERKVKGLSSNVPSLIALAIVFFFCDDWRKLSISSLFALFIDRYVEKILCTHRKLGIAIFRALRALLDVCKRLHWDFFLILLLLMSLVLGSGG